MKNILFPISCLCLLLLLFTDCDTTRNTQGVDAVEVLVDATTSGRAEAVFLAGTNDPPTATDAQVAELYSQLKSNHTLTLERLTYYLDAPILLSVVENFTLDGNGATLVMRDKNEDVVRLESSSNIILKNFKATHVEPEGSLGCRGSVIQAFNGANVQIENCRLNGSGLIGLVAYDIENLSVNSNYIYNNSEYGVLFDIGTSITLTRNVFADNGAAGDVHLAKALNPVLSELEYISKDQNRAGLKMSRNKFE